MSRIDPMYQFALDAYILMFVQSIERSQKSSDLEQRITILNEFHTYATYKYAIFINLKIILNSFFFLEIHAEVCLKITSYYFHFICVLKY